MAIWINDFKRGNVGAAKKRLGFGSDLKSNVDVLRWRRSRLETIISLRVLQLASLLKRIQHSSSIRRYHNKL